VNTDHPTTEVHFVFAMTYCRVCVYRQEERFAKQWLEKIPGVEIVSASASRSWQEVDTRILMRLVFQSTTQISEKIYELKKSITQIESVV
jgi:hypothetical protein